VTGPTASVDVTPRRNWLRWAGDCLAAERGRWALWGPVTLGIGIGVYFALDAEPAPWTGPGPRSAPPPSGSRTATACS